jgi:hypothetical protein
MDYDFSIVEEMAARARAAGEPRTNPYLPLIISDPTKRSEFRGRLFKAWETGWTRGCEG